MPVEIDSSVQLDPDLVFPGSEGIFIVFFSR